MEHQWPQLVQWSREEGGHYYTRLQQTTADYTTHNTTEMSLVNGYRVKCQNYKRMADREKEMRRREERLGR